MILKEEELFSLNQFQIKDLQSSFGVRQRAPSTVNTAIGAGDHIPTPKGNICSRTDRGKRTIIQGGGLQ